MSQGEKVSNLHDAFGPSVRAFAGRQREALQARRRLRREGVLVIVGGRGEGKSTLAAYVGSEEYPQARRVWIDCRYEVRDVRGILWLVAVRLSDDGLLEVLDSTDKQRPLAVLIERAVQAIERQSQRLCLLCLDALHHIYEEEGVAALVRSLAYRASVEGSMLRLIITADYPPPFLPEFGYLRLGKADFEITESIFARRHLALDEALGREIHEMTGGTPRLIEYTARLAEDIYASLPSQSRDESPRVERGRFSPDPLRNHYLVQDFYRVYSRLSPDERRVLTALALFDGPVPPAQVKKAVPEVEEARLVLYRLQDRGLVGSPSPGDVRVEITPALRLFCLDIAGEGTLRRMHHNLAEHFEYQGEILAAAKHYLSAGETEYAARFLLQYAEYVDRDTGGSELAVLVEQLLTLPPTRALPDELKSALSDLAGVGGGSREAGEK